MPKYLLAIVVLITFVAGLSYAAGGYEYWPDAHTLGLWHMNEGGGDRIVDASPNGFDGVVVGKADWGQEEWKKSGKVGKSFAFDGNTAINLGVQEKLIRCDADAITVEAWVYPEELDKLICCHWGAGSSWGSWEFVGTRFGVVTMDGRASVVAAGGQQLSLQEWQHVAGTYDGKTIRLYINGEPAGSTEHSGKFSPWTGGLDVVIGSKASLEYHWNGLIDEVRISSIAREPAELSPNLEGPQAVRFGVTTIPTLWAKMKSSY